MAFRTLDVFPNMELCGVGLNLTLANGRIGCANQSRTSNCAKKPKNANRALRSSLFGDSRRTREPRPADAG